LRGKWTVGLTAALLLTACGGGVTTQQTTASQLGPLRHHVTVTFWEAMAGGSQKPTLEQITNAFNQSQPYVTVQLQVYPDYSTLLQKLEAAIAAGNPPDMAQCYENWASTFKQAGVLANLAPYIDAKDGLSASQLADYWPTMLADAKLGGKFYMFPFNKSDSVLYYNPVMFKAAGISHPPTTWQEFEQDAQKLTDPAKNQWGTDFSLQLGYENLWEGMVTEFGGSLLNQSQTKATFQGSAGQQAIDVWAQMVKNGSAHTVEGYQDEDDYGSGHMGMMVGTIAGYSYDLASVGGRFPLKTAPVPAGPKGLAVEMFGTNACVFNKASQDVQHGAFLYIKYFTSPQNTMLWSEKTGYMPVRQSAYREMEKTFYPQNPNLKVAVAEMPHTMFAPSVPSWEEAQNDLLTTLYGIVQGKQTAGPALQAAAQKVDTLLTTA
jgi:multiple sugar transport system substrate-binding protein